MLKAIVNSPVRSGDQTILNGNLVIGTANKGIDFSANSHAAGMTSELLNDYEEGTFTPTFTNLTVGNGSVFGRYTKVGRIINIQLGFVWGSSSSIAGTIGDITGLPYTVFAAATNSFQLAVGSIFNPGDGWYSIKSNVQPNGTSLLVTTDFAGASISSTVPATLANNATLTLSFSYEVA